MSGFVSINTFLLIIAAQLFISAIILNIQAYVLSRRRKTGGRWMIADMFLAASFFSLLFAGMM